MEASKAGSGSQEEKGPTVGSSTLGDPEAHAAPIPRLASVLHHTSR